jgi:hypothetical protein
MHEAPALAEEAKRKAVRATRSSLETKPPPKLLVVMNGEGLEHLKGIHSSVI